MACRCGEKAGATTPGDAYGPIVVQENHYDPWGLGLPLNADAEKVGGSPEDRFTFQGQEKQKDLGWFQFKWRMSDPQTGRFISVDPLSEKYNYNSPYAFSENKVTAHVELEGLESVSAMVLGKAQNTWNGIINRASDVGSTAASYLQRTGNSISNALTPVDGIAFYSTNNDIKFKGGGMRQSQYPTGPMVEIDPILGPAGVATADPSKALLSGATVLGKIISAVEMMKEALGFGQAAGDAINSALPSKPEKAEEGATTKNERPAATFTRAGFRNAVDSALNATTGYTNASYGASSDSTYGLINYSNGFGPVRQDTLKPNNNEKK